MRPHPQLGTFYLMWVRKVMGRNDGGKVNFPVHGMLESAGR